jgi:hypothetical protein
MRFGHILIVQIKNLRKLNLKIKASIKPQKKSNTVSGTGNLDISFGNMFQVKYKVIMIVIIIVVAVAIAATVFIIFLYCYCNNTKIVITAIFVSSI